VELDDISEFLLIGEERSELLKFVKESNGHIAIVHQFGKVGKICCPDLKRSSKELEFGTN
jgi:hypothetical protein